MVAAVDPEILLAEGRVDEIAVMRTRRIIMGIGPEMPATDTHALDGNGAPLLKLADDGDELHEQLLLVVVDNLVEVQRSLRTLRRLEVATSGTWDRHLTSIIHNLHRTARRIEHLLDPVE